MRKALVFVFFVFMFSVVFGMTILPKEYLVEWSYLIITLAVLFIVLTFFVFLSKKTSKISENISESLPTEIKILDKVFEVITFLKEDEGAINGYEVIKRAKELNAYVSAEDIDCVFVLKELLPKIFMEHCLIFIDSVDKKDIDYLSPRVGNVFHQYYLTWDKESSSLEENCWAHKGDDNAKNRDLFFKKDALLLRRKS